MSRYPWRPTEEQRTQVEIWLKVHPIKWTELSDMLEAPYYAVIEQFQYLKDRREKEREKKRRKARAAS